MSTRRKGRAASNSFSAEEVRIHCDIWAGLLQGKDVQQLLKSAPARNIMRKFLAMRATLANGTAPKENTETV
jgi:hypothetical protein